MSTTISKLCCILILLQLIVMLILLSLRLQEKEEETQNNKEYNYKVFLLELLIKTIKNLLFFYKTKINEDKVVEKEYYNDRIDYNIKSKTISNTYTYNNIIRYYDNIVIKTKVNNRLFIKQHDEILYNSKSSTQKISYLKLYLISRPKISIKRIPSTIPSIIPTFSPTTNPTPTPPTPPPPPPLFNCNKSNCFVNSSNNIINNSIEAIVLNNTMINNTLLSYVNCKIISNNLEQIIMEFNYYDNDSGQLNITYCYNGFNIGYFCYYSNPLYTSSLNLYCCSNSSQKVDYSILIYSINSNVNILNITSPFSCPNVDPPVCTLSDMMIANVINVDNNCNIVCSTQQYTLQLLIESNCSLQEISSTFVIYNYNSQVDPHTFVIGSTSGDNWMVSSESENCIEYALTLPTKNSFASIVTANYQYLSSDSPSKQIYLYFIAYFYIGDSSELYCSYNKYLNISGCNC